MTTPDAGAWRERRHRLPVRIYYEDTDFTGVVFHGAYVNFLERGRTEALRTLGIGHAELQATEPPLAFAVVRIEIDYKRPATIDDVLVVETAFEGFRGAVMHVAQQIFRRTDLIAQARVLVACIDRNGRPRRPSKAMSEALAGKVF